MYYVRMKGKGFLSSFLKKLKRLKWKCGKGEEKRFLFVRLLTFAFDLKKAKSNMQIRRGWANYLMHSKATLMVNDFHECSIHTAHETVAFFMHYVYVGNKVVKNA